VVDIADADPNDPGRLGRTGIHFQRPSYALAEFLPASVRAECVDAE
jgi:hypothetical protein